MKERFEPSNYSLGEGGGASQGNSLEFGRETSVQSQGQPLKDVGNLAMPEKNRELDGEGLPSNHTHVEQQFHLGVPARGDPKEMQRVRKNPKVRLSPTAKPLRVASLQCEENQTGRKRLRVLSPLRDKSSSSSLGTREEHVADVVIDLSD
jgi:hypothetical protein